MSTHDWIQIFLYLTSLILLTPILGKYMGKVFQGQKHILSQTLGWMEQITYKTCKINSQENMSAKKYLACVVCFNILGFLSVFVLQLLQSFLPMNPQHFSSPSWHSALNTAVSFMTNTNWQSYAGETTLSYFVQMMGLTVQNFLSAATGIAIFLALSRGISEKESNGLGNFWTDITRCTVYILLPLSLILAVILISQGVVQNFSSYITTKTLEGTSQILPMGPAASQIAIKQWGTNGGGFFNANSAHPFENPTALSNFLQVLAILLIPSALTYTYGMMVKAKRQGWILFLVMLTIYILGLMGSLYSEYQPIATLGHNISWEGKETRLGITNSILWSTSTTAASNGSVNAMHSSLTPLSGGIALFNIMVGEIIFGGVGSGLYGMLMFVFLTVFLCGLMVGKTPEYLGKKIETREISLVMVAVLMPSAAILLGSGLACILPAALSSLSNKGPHGFSEILYAFSSASQNNGSAFAGLNANTVFYNIILALCMLIGRFSVIIPTLLVAGHLASKKTVVVSEGSFATDSFLFYLLLISIILVIGALTFFPALALGPITEHLLMRNGAIF